MQAAAEQYRVWVLGDYAPFTQSLGVVHCWSELRQGNSVPIPADAETNSYIVSWASLCELDRNDQPINTELGPDSGQKIERFQLRKSVLQFSCLPCRNGNACRNRDTKRRHFQIEPRVGELV